MDRFEFEGCSDRFKHCKLLNTVWPNPLQSVVKCHELMDMVLYKYFITIIIITSTLFNPLTPIMTKT